MFKVIEHEFKKDGIVALRNTKSGDFLHSDGSVYSTTEWWPTREDAQAVLDKFYPAPKHVWEHGDVFKSFKNDGLMMFINDGGRRVFYLPNNRGYSVCKKTPAEDYLENGTLLFNIREKL